MEIRDIITSVESGKLVQDPRLINGFFERNNRGDLQRYSGGYTIVFPVIATDGSKWAFRCWHNDVGAEKERYKTLSDEIKRLNSPYLAEFVYVENGIIIKGTNSATTRMRWVDGLPLNDYLKKYKDDRVRLSSLINEFAKMCKELHRQQVAHGDLQHGNILVTETGKLVLVDYDSMYVPKLGRVKDIIAGKPEYQHPCRAKNKYASEKLDYFSELVIYISLLTIARKPELLKKFNIEDSLLFKASDFTDLPSTSIYKTLSQCGEDVTKLLGVLNDFLKENDINKLRPIEVVLCDLESNLEVTPDVVKKSEPRAELRWTVARKSEVKIFEDGKLIHTQKGKGKKPVSPTETATYRMEVLTEDGITVVKEVILGVYEEAVIKFEADKKYSYPEVPIVLSWDVDNAVSVTLNSKPVSENGNKVVYPKKETTYTLKVTDRFGEKESKIKIRMLPLPQIKMLLVSAPTDKPLVLKCKPHIFRANIALPTFKIPFVKQHVPIQPTLRERGLYVNLKLPKKVGITTKIKDLFKTSLKLEKL